MTFDVNAARAQRLEAHGAAFEFTVDGESFSLPTELAVDALGKMASLEASDLKGVVSTVMGDAAAAERLFSHSLSVQDVKAVLDAWRSETGVSVGEGSPSVS